MKISSNIQTVMERFHSLLDVQKNFDIVYHTMEIGGKQACLYFIDGFTKDEVLLKLMQTFSTIKESDMPSNAHDFSKKYVTYGETGLETDEAAIAVQLLSGLSCLFIDGYFQCITIDCRTYPARSVGEPEKDKSLRGSRDGFVETIVFNTALIRRPESWDAPLQCSQDLDTRVSILKIHPGITPQVVRNILCGDQTRAVIIETYGSGNAPSKEWFLNTVREASASGKILLNITQCLGGCVNMDIYSTGKALKNAGVLNGYDSTTESALAKLFYLMGQSDDNGWVKSRVEENLRGEITK